MKPQALAKSAGKVAKVKSTSPNGLCARPQTGSVDEPDDRAELVVMWLTNHGIGGADVGVGRVDVVVVCRDHVEVQTFSGESRAWNRLPLKDPRGEGYAKALLRLPDIALSDSQRHSPKGA